MKRLNGEKFIVDPRGKKVGVVLDLGRYQQLLEDFRDLTVIAMRKRNPKLTPLQLIARLKKRGSL